MNIVRRRASLRVAALSKYMASKFSAEQCEYVTGLICHLAGPICSYY